MSSSLKSNPEYIYEAAFFKLTAKTPLHVGSGSENYGVIDNLVQRDALTNFPTINASSLKGALREFFKHYIVGNDKNKYDTFLRHVFGHDKSDVHDDGEGEEKDDQTLKSEESDTKKHQAGKYRFLQADLLTIPIRSDVKLFFRVTSPWLIQNYITSIKDFGKTTSEEVSLSALIAALSTHLAIQFSGSNAKLEDIDITAVAVANAQLSSASTLLGTDVAIAKDEILARLTSDYYLPVVARNHLEDGQSTNLWYEQIVPRETAFFFHVLYPIDDSQWEEFCRILTTHPVQVGANASIGYGFCDIELIATTKKA